MMGRAFHVVEAQKQGLLELGHDLEIELRVRTSWESLRNE